MVCPSNVTSAAGAVATAAASLSGTSLRNIMYFDQWHTAVLPNNSVTTGVTHVITAFANSSLFTTDPVGEYTPFMPLTDVRAMFDNGTKVCMAIGGWGDSAGFRVGMASEASRALYAQNIATTLDTLGYDCIDIDYEYPGGNGYDYIQVPNEELVSDIDNFPLFLAAIKQAIGSSKELSVATPAKESDMIAFTAETVPLIDAAVDYINIMTYDLMNRRDTVTKHHTDVAGSLAAVDAYLARGMSPAKINLGIAFYAKWFTLAANTTCTSATGTGCAIAAAEGADGTDLGTSGAATFEASSLPLAPVDPATLTASGDGSCGSATTFSCAGTTWGRCCSQWGFCGDTTDHCVPNCQVGYGECDTAASKTTAESFAEALANGQTDAAAGAQWYVDAELGLFWTWDTPALIARKFTEIVAARGLGGVMAWSLAEDSYDWSHLQAMREGVAAAKASASASASKRRARRNRLY